MSAGGVRGAQDAQMVRAGMAAIGLAPQAEPRPGRERLPHPPGGTFQKPIRSTRGPDVGLGVPSSSSKGLSSGPRGLAPSLR